MNLNLHPGQSEVFNDIFIKKDIRFATVCCSRGWGKSYLGGAAGIQAVGELTCLPPTVPHKNVFIVAPTFEQVIDIYFPLIMYEMGMENYVIDASEHRGRLLFPNNVELRLLSYEAVQRARGKGSYFTIWDEVSSCTKGCGPKEAWESCLEPCMRTRWSRQRALQFGAPSPGRGICVSTPKGFNYFKELYDRAETSPDWGSYHYDYHSSPFLDPDEIAEAERDLDPVLFASEYKASFTESAINTFYMFDRKLHVDPTVEDFNSDEEVHLCIDFNVGLQCTSICAIRGTEVHFIDEVQGHPDTETLAISLKTRYPKHKRFAYPDPSGRSRKTSAKVGVTDFSILESQGMICLADLKAPSIVDSVACTNRMLKNAAGDVRIRIHPRCKGLIQSLERTKWVDNNSATATIDKSDGVEHYSDGIRYFMHKKFPILVGSKRTKRGFGF